MLTAADAAVMDLERRYPGWQVWHTPCYVKPDRWSARRHSQPKAEFQTRSAEDLEKLLAAATGAGE